MAQSGSAPVLGTGGREFESRRPDHFYSHLFTLSSRSTSSLCHAVHWGGVGGCVFMACLPMLCVPDRCPTLVRQQSDGVRRGETYRSLRWVKRRVSPNPKWSRSLFRDPVIKMIRIFVWVGRPHALVGAWGDFLAQNGLGTAFFRRNTGFSAFVHSGLSHYMLCAYLPGTHSAVSRKLRIETIFQLSTWACL